MKQKTNKPETNLSGADAAQIDGGAEVLKGTEDLLDDLDQETRLITGYTCECGARNEKFASGCCDIPVYTD